METKGFLSPAPVTPPNAVSFKAWVDVARMGIVVGALHWSGPAAAQFALIRLRRAAQERVFLTHRGISDRAEVGQEDEEARARIVPGVLAEETGAVSLLESAEN